MATLTTLFFGQILEMEGGYQNDPADNGNKSQCGGTCGTKYGVSTVAYEQWVGRCTTPQEMQGLTESDAQNFYAYYFDNYNLYPINDQSLFELCANNTMGNPTQAAKAEQRALNTLGIKVAIDGKRGKETIDGLNLAVQTYGIETVFNNVLFEWLKFLKTLQSKPFYQGWLNRMAKYYPPYQNCNDKTPGCTNTKPQTATETTLWGVAALITLIWVIKQ